jgi:hypothetical protein
MYHMVTRNSTKFSSKETNRQNDSITTVEQSTSMPVVHESVERTTSNSTLSIDPIQEENVSSTISDQTTSIDGNSSRSYADTLKFQQTSPNEHVDRVATLPMENLTITDTTDQNLSRDRHRNKRYHGGNTRLHHSSRHNHQHHTTVNRPTP